jgi:hypothetical protein
MNLRNRELYTHRNMIDCMIYIQNLYRYPNGDCKVKIKWFTRSGGDLGVSDTYVIKQKDLKNWRYVDPYNPPDYR